MVKSRWIVLAAAAMTVGGCSSETATPEGVGANAAVGAGGATAAIGTAGPGATNAGANADVGGASGAGATTSQGSKSTAGSKAVAAGTSATAGKSVTAGASGAVGHAGKSGAGSVTDGKIKVEPPPKDVSKWEADGPFTSVTKLNSGPGNAYTIYQASELGKNGMKHPIVTWGNGTSTTPVMYDGLLSHFATHGFVVVASNSTDTGSGQEMIAGFDWLITENSRSGSEYYGKLHIKAIGATGHSQGGIGTVLAAVDPRVTTAMPIAGGDPKVDQVHGPLFLIGFDGDTIVPPPWNMAPQFEAADEPTVYGVVQGGATHLEPMGDGGRIRGYATAWLVYQLMKDDSVSGVFYGKDCTLCTDSNWIVERKHVPGVVPPTPPTKDQCLSKANFPANATTECKNCLCGSCPLETVNCTGVCWNLATCMLKQCTANTSKDLGIFECTGITGTGVCGTYADGYRFTTALSAHGAGCMAPGKCLETCIP